jgi:hypothetical protein
MLYLQDAYCHIRGVFFPVQSSPVQSCPIVLRLGTLKAAAMLLCLMWEDEVALENNGNKQADIPLETLAASLLEVLWSLLDDSEAGCGAGEEGEAAALDAVGQLAVMSRRSSSMLMRGEGGGPAIGPQVLQRALGRAVPGGQVSSCPRRAGEFL